MAAEPTCRLRRARRRQRRRRRPASGDGQVKGEQLSAFVASDDDDAKKGYFNIQLGMELGMGSEIGFELVH